MQPLRHAVVVTALLVVLAGCSAGLPSQTASPGTGAGTGSAGSTGTVALYLSDQPNAIGDFEHLNVTVTQVGFHPKAADGDEAEAADRSPTASPNATAANGTAASNATAAAAGDDDAAFGDWVVEPVAHETVDLTTLVGANATRIAGVELPAGEYNGVFIWVAAVNGTLQDGTSVEVKLPSERLKLNTHFAVDEDASVDFVFDIAVHETGTGRYILRPVISESGTDVPIEPAGGDGPAPADAGPDDGDGAPAANESDGGGPPDEQGQGQDN